jgi:ABC-type glutathione transport system ATPase component
MSDNSIINLNAYFGKENTVLQQLSQPNAAQHLIELRKVTKYYSSGSNSLAALNAINIAIERGEFVAWSGNRAAANPR